ncbi:hypothetical protein J3Q64DRAFT_1833366 [Phycomyces blakesleeanus]|uniref:Uncharacterized protein n=2 Tax=Phycomyces blakesleeanus TaxID=4837 RepID=A0A167KCP6_PHYB8|nr:hypothetical protein PHYBLDRAFT_151297 [Phycomyces blakesleeanus NRRL 1555(-)]OAD67769.1 hypothetical protein PHYBLDRAFT_151297 [Phycomyces blakesleeanus NRRL 1555(-)]|eukprot:XP_018285809.1 hypothetical protein PHYBLDRAFT_151297 [Phycomyces blakesleeanus NRRL 1555(-)]
MSLGRLTVNINAHESGTIHHSLLSDQTTKGIHRPFNGRISAFQAEGRGSIPR